MEDWKKVRKRPVEVEAWGPWDGTLEGIPKLDGLRVRPGAYLEYETLEGVLSVSPGDYIIRGVKGELYRCKPDVFEATYEVVEE